MWDCSSATPTSAPDSTRACSRRWEYVRKLEFPGAVCFENADDGDSVWIESPKSPDQRLVTEHIAFRAKDEEAVKAFHAAGLAAGGTDNGQPGPRPNYGPTYYAAFIHDPDGNNIEAMLQ